MKNIFISETTGEPGSGKVLIDALKKQSIRSNSTSGILSAENIRNDSERGHLKCVVMKYQNREKVNF